MRIKSNIYQQRFECQRCLEAEDNTEQDGEEDQDESDEKTDDKKRQKHCHCPLWSPSPELVESMSAGQPSRRYKMELKRKKDACEIDRIMNAVDEETRAKEKKKTLKVNRFFFIFLFCNANYGLCS